ncbi:hypothetical protein KIN20_015638 [Parelaphostrongylus tenuis]|uniref:Uncharacterized protein n=1 Tax=Parelaphostrongylus tenuis TaxID=148309 RepID=A0AAD5QMD9_PARTN|nr:hypothetical protein KIN20_015638 [Parelaphostrongylus tenuis]
MPQLGYFGVCKGNCLDQRHYRRSRIPKHRVKYLETFAETAYEETKQSAPPAEKILDAQEIVDFDKSMRKLRLNVSRLPKDRFSTGEQEITEKQWSVGRT